jgi:hypothetical protein
MSNLHVRQERSDERSHQPAAPPSDEARLVRNFVDKAHPDYIRRVSIFQRFSDVCSDNTEGVRRFQQCGVRPPSSSLAVFSPATAPISGKIMAFPKGSMLWALGAFQIFSQASRRARTGQWASCQRTQQGWIGGGRGPATRSVGRYAATSYGKWPPLIVGS